MAAPHVCSVPYSPLTRWAFAMSAVAAGIGIAALVVWQLGSGEALALGRNLVPTAPGSAVLVLLIASAVLVECTTLLHAARRTPVARALAAMAVALAVLVSIFAAGGREFPLERWLYDGNAIVGGVPLGRVSQYTALLFALIGLALLLPRATAAQRRVATVLTLVALGLSALILQGYVLGAPLLYGASTIPVAALTALTIALLSASTALVVGADQWPLRMLMETGRTGPPSRAGFRALAIALGVFVGASGYFWYRAERGRAEDRAETVLRTIANVTADRIAAWHAGQIAAARTTSAIPLNTNDIRRLVNEALRPNASTALDTWLRTTRELYAYETVGLFTTDGVPIAFSPASPQIPVPTLAARVRVLESTEVRDVTTDPVPTDSDARPLTIWVPLQSQDAGPAPRLWLMLQSDTRRTLLNFVRDIPLESASAEIVVYTSDGSAAVPLHTVRTPLAGGGVLRLPLNVPDPAPGARGLLGFEGIVTAPDYRGVPVSAAVLPIPGTPWVATAKIDRAEIESPIRRSAIRATILSLAFLLTVAGAVYSLWYRRDLAAAERELELIRDRERTLDALRTSEDRYARAMRGATDGLWDWNIVTGELYVSPQWTSLYGTNSADARSIEAGFFDRLHPDDAPGARAALDAHFEAGTPYSVEIRLRADDGSYRWCWTRGEAERNPDGLPIRMAGSITDITARRAAEEALQRADRILRVRSAANLALVRAKSEQELLQSVCDIAVREGGYRMAWIGFAQDDAARSVRPMAIAGLEDGYLEANPVSWGDNERGQGPTGRCIRSGEPQVAQDLLAERDYAPWRSAAQARGFASSCSIPVRVDGQVIGAFMLYSSEPFAFHTDEVTLLDEIGHDLSFGVSAVRDHHAVVLQQEELTLFREVMERSADAIFIVDLETARFLDVNETACRQLGYTAHEMRALRATDIVPRIASSPAWTETVTRVSHGEERIRRSKHRRKDGSEFPVEVSRTVIQRDGASVMLAIARDISERVAAEVEREALQEQLLRAQRMESVGRLAGGVAHDFNNLLTVINTTADLAFNELPSEAPLRHDLLEIRAAGDRAAALTRQLLAFSRQSVMKRESLNLNEVVSNFLKLLRRVIGEDIRVEVGLASQSTPVLADPNQLEQVLMNLCVNARDAMPKGGTLIISTELAHLDQEHAARHETMSPGEYVLLSVTDTGEGMSPEVQSRIFDPFFTTKAAGKGTGLGLATVYGIVKQSGGSIWVYSEIGRGTSFKIYLPITTQLAQEPTSAQSTLAATGTETVLVVEDEDAIRMVVDRVLTKAGYTVLKASNGADALALLAAHTGPLDLVMTDLVMPGMTGVELARTLRTERPSLPVLLSSGYSAEALASQVDAEHGWQLISKPYAVKDLLLEVRRVLDEARSAAT